MNSLLLALEPALICLTTFVLSCGTYFIWPSRWNLLAHVSLAFWAVAFFLPAGILQVQNRFPEDVRLLFVKTLIVGSIFYIVGLTFGALHRRRFRPGWVAQWLGRPETKGVATRTALVGAGAAGLVLLAIVGMGFAPMFADDPIAAKFFRGRYAEPYARFSVPYRLGTSIIAAVITLVAAYALRKNRIGWRILLLTSLSLMMVTLQRGPAASGLLLLVGILLIQARRTGTFLTVALSVYVLGTLFYVVLGLLGVGGFLGIERAPSLFQAIAATAPDVTDALGFLSRWTDAGEPTTSGRTFYGGLIPGNYPWNPGVWTVTLGNAGFDLQSASTGGLRLPAPLWGLVSFGSVGVILVCLVSGLFAGYLAAAAAAVLPGDDTQHTALIVVRYQLLASILPLFYASSYTTIVQLAALIFISATFQVGRPARRAQLKFAAQAAGTRGGSG